MHICSLRTMVPVNYLAANRQGHRVMTCYNIILHTFTGTVHVHPQPTQVHLPWIPVGPHVRALRCQEQTAIARTFNDERFEEFPRPRWLQWLDASWIPDANCDWIILDQDSCGFLVMSKLVGDDCLPYWMASIWATHSLDKCMSDWTRWFLAEDATQKAFLSILP